LPSTYFFLPFGQVPNSEAVAIMKNIVEQHVSGFIQLIPLIGKELKCRVVSVVKKKQSKTGFDY